MNNVLRIAALVPVKSFDSSKSRLSAALDQSERRDLAERLAAGVVGACSPMPTFVVCEDDGVARWARGMGANVVRSPYSGLNRVVRYGVSQLSEAGFARVMVAHADLSDPANLAGLERLQGIVLVPDAIMDGTNVLVVPTRLGFRFSYGPNSFARHLSEAERTRLDIHVVDDDPGLSLDLDDPEDLHAYTAQRAEARQS